MSNDRLGISIAALALILIVVVISITYPKPEIIETYDAELISVSEVWYHGKANKCKFNLNNGLIVEVVPCLDKFKKGDKVVLSKMWGRGGKTWRSGGDYIIQEFITPHQ